MMVIPAVAGKLGQAVLTVVQQPEETVTAQRPPQHASLVHILAWESGCVCSEGIQGSALTSDLTNELVYMSEVGMGFKHTAFVGDRSGTVLSFLSASELSFCRSMYELKG